MKTLILAACFLFSLSSLASGATYRCSLLDTFYGANCGTAVLPVPEGNDGNLRTGFPQCPYVGIYLSRIAGEFTFMLGYTDPAQEPVFASSRYSSVSFSGAAPRNVGLTYAFLARRSPGTDELDFFIRASCELR